MFTVPCLDVINLGEGSLAFGEIFLLAVIDDVLGKVAHVVDVQAEVLKRMLQLPRDALIDWFVTFHTEVERFIVEAEVPKRIIDEIARRVAQAQEDFKRVASIADKDRSVDVNWTNRELCLACHQANLVFVNLHFVSLEIIFLEYEIGIEINRVGVLEVESC